MFNGIVTGCDYLPLDLTCFKNAFPGNLMLENEPMKKYTSFRVGGAADLLFFPDSVRRLAQAIDICRKNCINYYIVGNCTNLLVRDGGYRGVIIKLGKSLADIIFTPGFEPGSIDVTAQAGALLSDISSAACERGLTGFEFASGIPGTLGGAVCMNAGAYGGEIKDILISAKLLNHDGSVEELSNSQMEFGYRRSVVQKTEYVVISAVLRLKKGEETAVGKKVEELYLLRSQKQPLEQPSAGSTFKRPDGYYTGKLVTDAGLCGYKIGGAMVSEKHSGFIVNYKDATAKDIVELINYVVLTVKEKFDVTLEPEVKIIGEM